MYCLSLAWHTPFTAPPPSPNSLWQVLLCRRLTTLAITHPFSASTLALIRPPGNILKPMREREIVTFAWASSKVNILHPWVAFEMRRENIHENFLSNVKRVAQTLVLVEFLWGFFLKISMTLQSHNVVGKIQDSCDFSDLFHYIGGLLYNIF